MIKRIIRFYLTVLLGLLTSVYSYSGEDAETIIKKLQKKYDTIKDASINYTQNIQFGVTKNEQTFSGRLIMKRGNKYRIQMEQQTIITDGKSVWSVNLMNRQVVIDKYHDDPKTFSPDKIMVNVPDNYNASILGKEKLKDRELLAIKLIPKNKKSNIRWMKVWVDEDDLLMKKIQVLEVSDNLSTYTIDELKINQGISDKEFLYEAPSGIEVIDLR